VNIFTYPLRFCPSRGSKSLVSFPVLLGKRLAVLEALATALRVIVILTAVALLGLALEAPKRNWALVPTLPLNSVVVMAAAVVLPVLTMVRVPVIVPVTVGANATDTVQVLPAETDRVQPFVSLNAAFVTVTDDTVSDVVPVLDTVTVCVALVVPTAWDANVSVPGVTVVTAAPNAKPGTARIHPRNTQRTRASIPTPTE